MAAAYYIAGLEEVAVGKPIDAGFINHNALSRPQQSGQWRFPVGTFLAKDIITQLAPLFDHLVIQLGEDKPGDLSSRDILLSGLHSSLSLDSSESTLPIQAGAEGDAKELAVHASKIAKYITHLVSKTRSEVTSDGQLSVKSPREGYLWREEVTALLAGPRSNNVLMQLYNEWLHQLVLLRDSLLPFENFSEVPLTFDVKANGLRAVETARNSFSQEVISGAIQRTALLNVAKAHTAPSLPSGGYAFQFERGMVLPLSLFTGEDSCLSRYVPATVTQSAASSRLLFVPQRGSHLSMPRTNADPGRDIRSWPSNIHLASLTPAAELMAQPVKDGDESMGALYLHSNSNENTPFRFSVDVAWIVHGIQNAYRLSAHEPQSAWANDIYLHDPTALLHKEGLIMAAEEGIHAIPVKHNVLKLALLGKLYPGNVVLGVKPQDIGKCWTVGKSHGPKFVIVDVE